jgi:hypothetical protein
MSIGVALFPVLSTGLLMGFDSGGPAARTLLSLSAILLCVFLALPVEVRRKRFAELASSTQARLFIVMLCLIASILSIEFYIGSQPKGRSQGQESGEWAASRSGNEMSGQRYEK